MDKFSSRICSISHHGHNLPIGCHSKDGNSVRVRSHMNPVASQCNTKTAPFLSFSLVFIIPSVPIKLALLQFPALINIQDNKILPNPSLLIITLLVFSNYVANACLFNGLHCIWEKMLRKYFI